MLTLVDGLPATAVAADDRGLAYGDGVFRTLVVRDGHVQWWARHYARLAADCRALDIEAPGEAELVRDVARIIRQMPDCALRITVTRGSGGRGYAAPGSPRPRRIVAASQLPACPPHWPEQGVTVRLCSLRLSAQPRLAGVKHLNRLENVLARAEWNDPEIVEGLLMDETGNVIEGTRCNLFIVEGGAFLTPDLSRCGVAGVTRDLVMASADHHGFSCRSGAISRDRLRAADEVLLVNSLIGVWPVAVLEGRRWSGFKFAPRVRKWLDGFADPSR